MADRNNAKVNAIKKGRVSKRDANQATRGKVGKHQQGKTADGRKTGHIKKR